MGQTIHINYNYIKGKWVVTIIPGLSFYYHIIIFIFLNLSFIYLFIYLFYFIYLKDNTFRLKVLGTASFYPLILQLHIFF